MLSKVMSFSFCFFFFQAEDGIRDLYVTGVQTCALPISRRHHGVPHHGHLRRPGWVPAGWRAVGRLQVKGAEHELACRFDLRLDDSQPCGPPRLKVAGSLVIDSQWVTRQRIPALGRRIVMTCSLSLEPDM